MTLVDNERLTRTLTRTLFNCDSESDLAHNQTLSHPENYFRPASVTTMSVCSKLLPQHQEFLAMLFFSFTVFFCLTSIIQVGIILSEDR